MSQYTKHAGDILTVTVPFTVRFAGCELLTGTPTVAEVGSSDLTITNVALNAESVCAAPWWLTTMPWRHEIANPANSAVQFSVSGGTRRTAYTLRITVTTDTTPAQTLVEDIRLQVT